MAMLKRSEVFMSPVLKASFVDLDKPNDKGGYGLALIIPKDDPEAMGWLTTFLGPQVNQIANETWPDPARRPRINPPVKDSNVANSKGKIPAIDWDYGDSYFLRVGSNRKPKVIGREKVGGVYVQLPEGSVESGNCVRVTASIYSFENPENTGITFGLDAVQKVSEGEPFKGTSSVGMFDEIALPAKYAQQVQQQQVQQQQVQPQQVQPQQVQQQQVPTQGNTDFNWS